MAKILLIDDSEEMRDLFYQILSKRHEVYAVNGWAGATPYIFRENVDLILMDVDMPGVKGDKIPQLLQESVTVKKLKIVLFSSMDRSTLRQLAAKAGVLGYLQKTTDEAYLFAKIDQFLRE